MGCQCSRRTANFVLTTGPDTKSVVASQFASSEDIFEARELVDEFTQFERRSEILADFTTRELVTELSDRLERRGQTISKKSFKCVYCGKKYDTAAKVCRLFGFGFFRNGRVLTSSLSRPSSAALTLCSPVVADLSAARGWVHYSRPIIACISIRCTHSYNTYHRAPTSNKRRSMPSTLDLDCIDGYLLKQALGRCTDLDSGLK